MGANLTMLKGSILVRANWDPEAGVFVATSDDVPGLVAEAATQADLEEKLKALIPELLELNGDPVDNMFSFDAEDKHYADIPLVLMSERVTKVRVYA